MSLRVGDLQAIGFRLAEGREQAHVEPRRDIVRVGPLAVLAQVRAGDLLRIER